MCRQYSTKIIRKDHQHYGIVLTSTEFYGSWGIFLYVIHCFGALIRVQKTESMSHRLQQFVVTFHRYLHHIFLEVYGQCLYVGVFHFTTACGAPIGPRSFSFADLPLKFDELTRELCPTYEQFHHMNIFCPRLQHFPHFSSVVADKGLPDRCLLLTVFRPLLNCLIPRVTELHGIINFEPTSSSAF